MAIYKEKEFYANEIFQKAIKVAGELWQKKTEEYLAQEEKNGREYNSYFTHTHSSGFFVKMILAKCRKPKDVLILSPYIGRSDINWSIKKEIEAVLKDSGIECFYFGGYDD